MAIPNFRRAAAEGLADQANWCILKLADPTVLASFVALAATDSVPNDFAVLTPDITAKAWLSVSTAARPALLLVQNLLLMATVHQPGLVSKPSDAQTCKRVGAHVLSINMDKLRLQQEGTLSADSIASSASSRCNDHIQSLRVTLLLVKVERLLSFL